MPEDRRDVLVIAHPGHELLVYNWLERHRPIVCVLTDGSGLDGVSRLDRTRHIIEQTGSSVGPVFGMTDEKTCYAGLLNRDGRVFAEAALRLCALFDAVPVGHLVCDATEFANPVHDVCASLTLEAAARARRAPERVFTMPIETGLPEYEPAGALTWTVSGAALARKLDAVDTYVELTNEVAAARAHRVGLETREVLVPIELDRRAIDGPSSTPAYETLGKQRKAEGRVPEAILFESHVRPTILSMQEIVRRERTRATAL